MRFRPDYDDTLSGGYRDIQLSVKIKSEKLKAHGEHCTNHRCEVQLHLKSFYDLKTSGGHAGYTLARNLRGA